MHFLVTLVYNGEFAINPIAIWQIYFQDVLILAFSFLIFRVGWYDEVVGLELWLYFPVFRV